MAENTPRVLDERDVACLAQKYLHGEFLGLSEFIRTVEDAVITQQRHLARGYSLMNHAIEKALNNS